MSVLLLGIITFFTSAPFKYKWCAKQSGFERLLLKLILHHADKFVILTLVKAVQYPDATEPKASSPMLVTLEGIFIEVIALQPEKAASPMLVTPLGIVTEVKLLQREKALRLMLVTRFGIVTEVKLLQP